MGLAQEIKEYALELGFCKAGITSAQPFTEFMDELYSRGDYYTFWHQRFERGAYPEKIMPTAKSIIVLAYDYMQVSYPQQLADMIGRVYLSRCYLPLPGTIHNARLQLFQDFLEQKGMHWMPDENSIPMRRAAAHAGVANFGKNNFAYVDGVGSFVILYGFLVDKELEYDTPTMENKCPDGCSACQKACPTQAIYEPFKLNPSRCVGYNNWMRTEDRGPLIDTNIPYDLREQVGTRIHGCDVCQAVCPRNRQKMKTDFSPEPFMPVLQPDLTLENLLHMPDGFYESCVHPVMYNYIRDIKYFQRNAAIAMGNTKDEAYLPHLKQELSHPEEMVRAYVVWALGRIGGEKAKGWIKEHSKTERSALVNKEIKLALGSA